MRCEDIEHCVIRFMKKENEKCCYLSNNRCMNFYYSDNYIFKSKK